MGATADDIYNMQPQQPEPEREGAQGALKLIDSGDLAIHIFGDDPEIEIFICDAADGYGYTYKTVKKEAEAIRLIESTPEEYLISFFHDQVRKSFTSQGYKL